MKRDLRDPEEIGKALIAMKANFPNKSAPERADLLATFQYHPMPSFPTNGINGKK